MKDLTREQFIAQTVERSERASNESIRAKYWEIAGKALGYLEPPKIENANIAVFQSVSQGMMEFLQKKSLEFQDLDTNNFLDEETRKLIESKKSSSVVEKEQQAQRFDDVEITTKENPSLIAENNK